MCNNDDNDNTKNKKTNVLVMTRQLHGDNIELE